MSTVSRAGIVTAGSLWTVSLGLVDVVVVGSLNLDTTVLVPRLPAPGETVLGTGHFTDTGGKGANQAVAAARLGARTAMVGMVGDDPAGARLLSVLEEAGVGIAGVGTTGESGSGIAVITVDDAGENSIVVDPGANALVTVDHVERHAGMLADAGVVLAQLEIPTEAVSAAARLAGGTFILNPAPAAILPIEVMARIDILVPNATEAALLSGMPEPGSVEQAAEVAAGIRGPGTVVITLGADGAVVVSHGSVRHIPAPEVTAVDPTAAGDAFCGGLAQALAGGAELLEAVEWAVRCGAVTTTRLGAQAALPTREEVEGMETR
jgi:ribokinase